MALCGNALLHRGEPLDAEMQQRNLDAVSKAVAPSAREHQIEHVEPIRFAEAVDTEILLESARQRYLVNPAVLGGEARVQDRRRLRANRPHVAATASLGDRRHYSWIRTNSLPICAIDMDQCFKTGRSSPAFKNLILLKAG
jgi:hypothetical protein